MASPEHAAPAPSIPRRLFDLALPVIGLNVLGVLSLAVDTAMCGRLPDAPAALEALGFATQVVFLFMVLMMGLVVGATAMVSRAHGAKDASRVDHVLRQSTWFTVTVGVAVAALGNLTAEPILRALGATTESLPLALAYLRPSLGLSVFAYLTMLYAAVLRAVGNTRLPFLVALLSNALNVGFNKVLILGTSFSPALGVQGAALGTVASQAIGVVVLVFLLRGGSVAGLRLRLTPPRPDLGLARDYFRIGAPAALDMVIINAAFASIVGMLGRLDPSAVAAHGIGLRIQALAFVPALSVAQATGAMVGNALGAHDLPAAHAVVRASVRLNVAITTTLALLLVLGAHPIVAIFDVARGTPLHELSVMWMRLLGYGMPIVGVHIAYVGMLRGAGATKTSLWINLLGTIVQVPLSWLLGFPLGLGPWGVWMGFPASFVLKGVLGYAAYKRGAWARAGAKA
ncbi:MAG: MATE family efflux transporter [Sandaracinus sp.]|nr:MATE family efflux transporter [Sandaracinus sp.]